MTLPSDPYESAKLAGLRYVTGEGPGIQRKRSGKGFVYLAPDGSAVRDQETLARIRSLAIPPAWTQVWICPSDKGHLQAVGRDARGRKQYRYHPLYRAVRDQTKFGRMIAFGQALPKIREQVERDLTLPGLPKRKVEAAVVRLLETTFIRIGNDEYAKDNESFGLTTLHDEHVDIAGSRMRFHFRGKSGVEHAIELNDRKLARIVKECQDIPGYELFQYYGDDGAACRIDSADINNYLREITGEDFTAKDFRTWAGAKLAALELEQLGIAENVTQARKNIVAAIKAVARRLGNRPATCKAYYVHPAVLSAYENGLLVEAMQKAADSATGIRYALGREELCVLCLVQEYIAREVARPKALIDQLKATLEARKPA